MPAAERGCHKTYNVTVYATRMSDGGEELAKPHRHGRRQDIMHLCSLATADELEMALSSLAPLPEVSDVRAPETGLVMLQGRMGGEGAPFNLGEAPVTRAAVRLASGEIGISYLLGRDIRRARLAAIVDALGQIPSYCEALGPALEAPVRARAARAEARLAAETNATKVEFFTMARGEDAP